MTNKDKYFNTIIIVISYHLMVLGSFLPMIQCLHQGHCLNQNL